MWGFVSLYKEFGFIFKCFENILEIVCKKREMIWFKFLKDYIVFWREWVREEVRIEVGRLIRKVVIDLIYIIVFLRFRSCIKFLGIIKNKIKFVFLRGLCISWGIDN